MKLCKQCKTELKQSDGMFCSLWCKEQFIFENRKIKKAKIKKVRKCKCGSDLKKGQHSCDDCRADKRFGLKESKNLCKKCGNKIITKNYIKEKRKLCDNCLHRNIHLI